ncbi:MAG: hypothetical protein M3460_24850 [Actinomycetota bacterium]|nr:hypothetical protein [Actinomycetota bacterium]
MLVHARRAWLLDLGQLEAVTLIALASLVIDPFSFAAAVAILASWYFLRRAARLLSAYVRFLLGRTHPEEPERIRAQAAIFGLIFVSIWGAILLVLFITEGAARLELIGAISLLDRAALLVALLATIAIVFACSRQRMISKLAPGAKEPDCLSRRLTEISEEQTRPVTVYSGFRPFVGSGQDLVTWSLAQRLLPSTADAELEGEEQEKMVKDEGPSFTTPEIVDHLKKRIADLAFDPIPERQLPNLTVRDHIFVVGTHARDVPEYPEYADFVQVMSDTTKRTRHYLACQVPSWDGEVVTTVYVHVSLQGRTLYLEFSTLVLPPPRKEFRVVDRVGGRGIRAYSRCIAKTVWKLPETLVRCHLSLGTAARCIIYLARGKRWRKLESRGIDVGAVLSVRELGAAVVTDRVARFQMNTSINYFQYRDVVKHAKVIERRLLAAVLDFLVAKGIDTGEYQQRALTILSSGILHMGEGDVNVTGVVGAQGTFHSSQTPGAPNDSSQ